MTGEIAVLQQAIDIVSEEQSNLQHEIDAFAEFRDIVSHTYPPEDDDRRTEPTVELLEVYRKTVMSTSDVEGVNDDTIEESLERELSSGVAAALVSRAPFSNRLKRKLLVQTSTAIDQRTLFHEDLEVEKRALETAAAELSEIVTRVAELPDCTVHDTSLEELLETWEAYDELEDRCDQLIEQRQQQLTDPSRNVSVHEEEHPLCRYLYADLETTYPVLSAVATTYERIRTARDSPGTHRTPA